MPLFPGRTTAIGISNKILSMDADFFNCVYDILEEPSVLDLENYQHHHKTNRLEHSLNVAYKSYRIAKLRGYDARSTARGGLLHDLYHYDCEELDAEETKRHLQEHPKLALQNALELFDLNPIEQDIILKHMWGVTSAKPSYRESYVVTLMDKYCAIEEVMGFSPKTNEISRAMVARAMVSSHLSAF